jgi:hypothetical protein
VPIVEEERLRSCSMSGDPRQQAEPAFISRLPNQWLAALFAPLRLCAFAFSCSAFMKREGDDLGNQGRRQKQQPAAEPEEGEVQLC